MASRSSSATFSTGWPIVMILRGRGEKNERRARLKHECREVVAYCRGPYCVMAVEAVDLLRRKGYRARRMEAGVPEWRARGWRVEEGATG
jgi:rhodanese-related sulfurtransferase